MKCPDERAILEDWQRSRRGETMLHASHIADCAKCRERLRDLEILGERLERADAVPETGHLDGEARLAYVERSMPAKDREQVEKHLTYCTECRRDVMQLVLAGHESPQRTPEIKWWRSLVKGGGLALAGAVVTIAFLLVCPMLPNQQGGSDVTVYGIRGTANRDAVAVLRAVNPSDSDLDFAIAVWRKALEMNPDDKLAAAKLAELENRRASGKSDLRR